MSTSSIPQDFDAIFDLTANSFVDGLDASDAGMFDQEQYNKLVNFTSINDPASSGNTGTISPKDLMMDSTPAPPSTSFTDMSTPSFGSTGYFSHDPSPLFADADLASGHEDWESLFPCEGTHSGPKPEEPKLTTAVQRPAPGASPSVANDSSPGESPRAGRAQSTRHSSVSGVKARHRDKPLPPIRFDDSDPVAAKRARNTEAARKSRARKVEVQEQMERRIADLEQTLEETRQREQYWKSIAEAKQ